MEGRNCYSDEHYLPTFFYMLDPAGIANWSITYVDWSERKWHPRSYQAQDITLELMRNLTIRRRKLSQRPEKSRSRKKSALNQFSDISSKNPFVSDFSFKHHPAISFKDIRISISTILSHLSGKKVEKILYIDKTMSYDDVEIEDMEWNEELQAYTYPCPCGDLFQITKEDLKIGEEIARCPSCSLYITVIYNMEDFQDSRKKIGPAKTQPVAVA